MTLSNVPIIPKRGIPEAACHAHAERGADLYSTPYEALACLLAAEGERLPKMLAEPCCGPGGLVLPLRNRGYTVLASDLHDWEAVPTASSASTSGEFAPRAARRGDRHQRAVQDRLQKRERVFAPGALRRALLSSQLSRKPGAGPPAGFSAWGCRI